MENSFLSLGCRAPLEYIFLLLGLVLEAPTAKAAVCIEALWVQCLGLWACPGQENVLGGEMFGSKLQNRNCKMKMIIEIINNANY